MNWLSRLFLWLGLRTPRPIPSTREQESIIYAAELDYLALRLREQYQEPVFYRVDVSGTAVFGTVGDTIATLSIFPKGAFRKHTYIVVRLEDAHQMYKAWFQLAFIGFKVRFKKPTLRFTKAQVLPPRGH